MSLRKILTRIERSSPPALHAFHADLLYRWALNVRSRPMAVTDSPTMVFAPHQDDETLGCGGLIALKREQGISVNVVFLTDGRNAHAEALSNDAAAVERRQEALDALEALGVAAEAVQFLDAPDGGLGDLAGDTRERFVTRLAGMIQASGPGEVFLPHRKDRHRDHEAAYDLVWDALPLSGASPAVYEYPIWLFWRMPLLFALGLKRREVAGAMRLPIEAVRGKKERAISAHRSQLSEAILPSGFLRRFSRPEELYFRTDQRGG
jgi:LmbE family N-acetylglucosaminyl deacetylase